MFGGDDELDAGAEAEDAADVAAEEVEILGAVPTGEVLVGGSDQLKLQLFANAVLSGDDQPEVVEDGVDPAQQRFHLFRIERDAADGEAMVGAAKDRGDAG